MVKEWHEEGFSIKRMMKFLRITRSMFYYKPVAQTPEKEEERGRPCPGFSLTNKEERISDEQIQEFLMEAIEGEESVYGYRKLTHHLKTVYDLKINAKKVYRLCKEMGILLPQRKKKSKHPRRLARNHVITGPNEMWQLDIKYGSIEQSGRFFFVASAIDVFDRSIVGYYRGSDCKATSITNMIQDSLKRRNVPRPKDDEREKRLIIRTDNGPQFVSEHFGDFCEDQRIYHERIPKKSPNSNAFIESFHSILERECFQQQDFECFDHAYEILDVFIDFYNERRYHGSLNYLSPCQFLSRFQENNAHLQKISL
jgi:putative transposase